MAPVAALYAEPRITDPFEGCCPRCGQGVVVAELRGRPVALEREVLERFRCPQCDQIEAMGQIRTHHCARCGGSRWIGEPLPLRGAVVLRADGSARVFRGWRDEYEAVHRRHVCPG